MTQFNIGDKVLDTNVAEYATIVGYNKVGNRYDLVYDGGVTASWINPDDLLKVEDKTTFTITLKPGMDEPFRFFLKQAFSAGTVETWTTTSGRTA